MGISPFQWSSTHSKLSDPRLASRGYIACAITLVALGVLTTLIGSFAYLAATCQLPHTLSSLHFLSPLGTFGSGLFLGSGGLLLVVGIISLTTPQVAISSIKDSSSSQGNAEIQRVEHTKTATPDLDPSKLPVVHLASLEKNIAYLAEPREFTICKIAIEGSPSVYHPTYFLGYGGYKGFDLDLRKQKIIPQQRPWCYEVEDPGEAMTWLDKMLTYHPPFQYVTPAALQERKEPYERMIKEYLEKLPPGHFFYEEKKAIFHLKKDTGEMETRPLVGNEERMTIQRELEKQATYLTIDEIIKL